MAGNYVGVAADCHTALGNLQGGIRIENGANFNVIGSDPNLTAVNFLMANTIAWNGLCPATAQTGAGIAVVSNQAVGNSILANYIFGNGGLGIDLGDDGPTPNNGKSYASGPNYWQNSRQLPESFNNQDGTSTVYGSLASDSSSTFRLELFTNNGSDMDWNDEGTNFLADALVATDTYGNFQLVVPGTPQYVTATATYIYNTSEFSCYLGAKVQIVTYSATNTAEFHEVAQDPTTTTATPPLTA